MGAGYAGPPPMQIYYKNGDYFHVTLDSANYHEGSDATGSISFSVNQDTPPLMVYVSIIGNEHVLWRKRVRSGKSTRVVTWADYAQ